MWWRRGVWAVRLAAMLDLYDDAVAFARLLRGGGTIVRRADAIRAGITGRRLQWHAGKGRLRHPSRDSYLIGDVDLLDEVRAALLLVPASAVVSHQTAAALYGFGVLAADGVHVSVPAGVAVPQRRGVVAHHAALPFEPVEVLGVPCVPAARCAVDLARGAGRADALAVLDAALRTGTVTDERLAQEVALHEGLRGVRSVRDLAPLATPFAECRQETRLRLLLHDGRLPRPTPQLAVPDEWGVDRYRLDLGYPHKRVGIEYDGSSHLDRRRLRMDRQRHNWLVGHGWQMRYFTDDDLYQHPDRILQTVRMALR